MSHNQVVLLLGTNLGDKNQNLKRAEELISKRVGRIIKKSGILETEPEGFVSDHDFLNRALWVATPLSPVLLLKSVKAIEQEMGRVKMTPERYEDRIIDIDILEFNHLVFESETLILPHPQIKSRSFVKNLLKF